MYDALNSCVQHGHDSYMLNFHFLHIAGLSDTLVQLVGAVLNLDLDTLLDITPTNTSVEVAPPLLPPRSSTPSITTFISHCRGSAPRSSPPRTAGSWAQGHHLHATVSCTQHKSPHPTSITRSPRPRGHTAHQHARLLLRRGDQLGRSIWSPFS